MKLVIANNRSAAFRDFYKELQAQHPGLFDYTNYTSLLFLMDLDAAEPLQVINLAQGTPLSAYDGVYINGYLNTYELAASVAIACQAAGVPFVNKELADPPSMSKLSSYAKLASAGVRIPRTIAGTKAALLQGDEYIGKGLFPAVLKRADADRGIDNFLVTDMAEVTRLLAGHDDRSLWILQAYVKNNGFYRVGFHGETAKYCIFRSLGRRSDGNTQKAHMYKPKGGSNASLIELADVPPALLHEGAAAMRAMGRQIGGVDCLYDSATGVTNILEVNYNPQMVTIETFQDIRIKAFIDHLAEPWT